MSADVICTLSTTASTGALVEGEGSVGVGADVAAAAGLDVDVCFEVGAVDVVRPARLARGRGCAMALTAMAIISTKIQREVRFMNCIFLVASQVCQPAQMYPSC
jgi:hypothetical protein